MADHPGSTATASPSGLVRAAEASDAHGSRVVPGTWIDRYEVIELLGAGSMGRVYRVRDSDLRREVALKHINPGRGNREAAQERLRREALAMARIEHPAVVRLYDAQIVEGDLFVAMELARGGTLAQWMHERSRSWRDIVRVLVEAGRGLAAAHSVGLVHRDIKPSNILLDGHGRPKISDFGLARTLDDVPVVGPMETDATEALDASLTATGAVIGTPAYMAPEQLVGKATDARADQFAFCVALWEALFGARPFAGTTPAELSAAVPAGPIATPAPRSRVPRRFIAALRRGLAADPAARWPDMDSLVGELTHALGARQRWTVAAIVSTVAIASAGAAVAVMRTHDVPDPCQATAARMAEIWSTPRREALRTKLAAIDPQYGAGRFAKIAEAIDGGAQRWTAMRIEACRATRVEARQSEALLDRRISCLDRWLDELANTVGVAERAGDRPEVDQAVRATTELSPLAACADVRALSDVLPLPTGASERATAIELASRVNEIDVERRAGRIAGLPSKIREVVAAARKTTHDPTLAAALVVQARIDVAVRDHADAEATVRELAQVAARSRDDASAAFAWIQLIATLAEDRYKHSEASALVPTATAAVLRAGDPPDLRCDLLNAQSRLDLSATRETALELLNRARALLEQSGATNPSSPSMSRLADVMSQVAYQYTQRGEYETARARYREVVERYRVLYGEDSPAEAGAWLSIANTFTIAGKHEASLSAYRRAVVIREARLGITRTTALTHEMFAMSLHMLGRWEEALDSHNRAIRSYRANTQPNDRELARTVGNRADTLIQLGRFDESAQDIDEALAVLERDETQKFSTAILLYNRGELQRRRRRYADALRDFTRAANLAESVHERGLSILILALVGEGVCLLEQRRFGDAVARLNRALKLKARTDAAFPVALAHVYLGRASTETRRDVRGGVAAVRAARATLAAASDATNAYIVEEVDAWLAAHTR